MRRLIWKSLAGVTYTLAITDGSSTVTDLKPGAQPFVTQIRDDDDVWTPVRPQTGNIAIVGEVIDAELLLASNPVDRVVTLTSAYDGQSTVAWKGYLQTAAFSQPWDKGPNDISIPVVSHLGLLESYEFQRTDYLNFAEFIVELANVTGTAAYSKFAFPYKGDPTTTLAYNFSAMDFTKWDSNRGAYDYANYYEVLEEVCKLFGWVAIENGDTLCFVAPDDFSGFYTYTLGNLEAVAEGRAASYQQQSASVTIGQIKGADHTISYLPGCASVKVTGNPNLMDKTIWRMDVGHMEQANAEGATHPMNSDRTRYLHYYTKVYGSDSELSVLNGMTNPRWDNFDGDSDSISTGSCVSSDREYVTKPDGKNILVRDSGWMNHILFKAGSGWGGRTIATVTPRQQHYDSGLMDGRYFLIQFGCRRSSSFKNEWEDFDGNLWITFKIGTNTLYDGYAQIQSGKLYATTAVAMVNSPDGLGVLMQRYSGQISLEIKVPSVGDYWESGDYDYYYAITNLSISYIDPWTQYLWEPVSENVEVRTITGGYTETKEQTNKLTTYRAQQYGYGVVLSPTMAKISTLYDNKTPEAALADRMQAYHSVSRKKLSVQLYAYAMQHDPMHPLLPGSGQGMACLSQTVYWRDDMAEVTLYEIDLA